MKILISLVFLLITTSSFAVTFDGKFIQGSFILGKTEPGSEVFIDKRKVKDARKILEKNIKLLSIALTSPIHLFSLLILS